MSAPPAGPPPQVPPGPYIPFTALTATRNIVSSSSTPQDPVTAVTRRWAYLSREYPIAIVKYFDIEAIIQDGPQCGLVALAMIAIALGRKTSVDEIFAWAHEQGFTALGEMFDIRNMKKLCVKFVEKPSTVIAFPSKKTMVSDLIKGKLFLVPYDADANHEPCRKNGRSSHWAVVFGVLLMRHECYCLEGLPKLSADKPIYRAELGYDCEMGGREFLFARQGKSRHVAVWSFEELYNSCMQLNEASKKYEGMIVPEGGLAEGLRGKVIKIHL